MKRRTILSLNLVVMFSLFLLTIKQGAAQCETIDQSQLIYNGGMSARTLPQYTVWQDFTAGMTGTLCSIDVGFFNAMTGTGTLNIFKGTGTGGVLLQTQTVTVSGTGNFYESFSVLAPVKSGSVYTFQFIPVQGGGLPDPYGVQVESPGTYGGGEMRITDPSGTYPTGYDMIFNTYVSLSTEVPSGDGSDNIITVLNNILSKEITLKANKNLTNATLVIYNIMGQEIKAVPNISGQEIRIQPNNLVSGMYFIHLIESNKIIFADRLIIAD